MSNVKILPVYYECSKFECKYSPQSEGAIVMVAKYSEIVDKDLKCLICGSHMEIDLSKSLSAQEALIKKLPKKTLLTLNK